MHRVILTCERIIEKPDRLGKIIADTFLKNLPAKQHEIWRLTVRLPQQLDHRHKLRYRPTVGLEPLGKLRQRAEFGLDVEDELKIRHAFSAPASLSPSGKGPSPRAWRFSFTVMKLALFRRVQVSARRGASASIESVS